MNSSSQLKSNSQKPFLGIHDILSSLKLWFLLKFQVRKCEFAGDGNNNNNHVTNNKRRGSDNEPWQTLHIYQGREDGSGMSPDNAGNLEVVIEECVFQLFDEAESEIYVRKCEFCCDGNNNNNYVTNNKRRGSNNEPWHTLHIYQGQEDGSGISPDNAGNLEVVIEECVFQLLDEAESEIYVRKCEFCCDGNNNNNHVTNNKRRGSNNEPWHTLHIYQGQEDGSGMSPDNAGNLEVVIEECVFQLFDEAELEIYVRLYNANDILRLKGNHLLLMNYRYRRIQLMCLLQAIIWRLRRILRH
ncbi:hypothetical protein CEXT_549011 [Caerostris extrusa]|uniref:Uncharacterized protein n=1 Tax=Caerostris extrusa TaxID=172846 RepID=A0AAV4XSG0_CAEEX|nr:hypothetical protein CEXT_549011 [Caerostris extrusa]